MKFKLFIILVLLVSLSSATYQIPTAKWAGDQNANSKNITGLNNITFDAAGDPIDYNGRIQRNIGNGTGMHDAMTVGQGWSKLNKTGDERFEYDTIVSVNGSYYTAVTDYGYTIYNGTSAKDCIEAAGNFEAPYFGTVFLKSGTYTCDSEIVFPHYASLIGSGRGSILYFPTSNGLNITYDAAEVMRSFSRFAVIGNKLTGTIGIKHYGGASMAQRSVGLSFSDIYISRFDTSMYMRSIWHSSIRRIYTMTTNHSLILSGADVKVSVDECSFDSTDPYKLSQSKVNTCGIEVNSSLYGGTSMHPEDVTIDRTIVFGFGHGINITRCLRSSLSRVDVDFAAVNGIRVTYATGGLTISDSWIALNDTYATANSAIYIIDGSSTGPIKITGNELSSNYGTGNYGIRIYGDGGYTGLDIQDNEITGMDITDIYIYGVSGLTLRDNRCISTACVYSLVLMTLYPGSVDVSNNYFARMIRAYPNSPGNAQVKFGPNSGYQSTELSYYTTMPSGSTTASTLFSSMAGSPSIFIANSSTYLTPILEILGSDVSCGSIYGTCNQTGVTLHCSSAPTAAAKIRWCVRAVTTYNGG